MSGSPYGDGTLPVTVDPAAWSGRFYDPPISLDPGTLIGEIAAQLAAGLAQLSTTPIQVYLWPNFDKDTWWAGNDPAFAIVAYMGTKLGPPLSTNAMLQLRTIDFSVILTTRDTAWAVLNGADSVYPIIHNIEAALTGFQPTGCRNSYFGGEAFRERDPEGQTWLYALDYHVVTLLPMMVPQYMLINSTQISHLVNDSQSATATPYTVVSGGVILPTGQVTTAVTDATTGIVYKPGVDYIVNDLTGALAITSTGALTNGTKILVSTTPVLDTITVP